ncbi:hypothetical protein [Kushneria phyllosphaerae]|uniref:Uncharacterized protein n=1 Tax=Kushneria phyllosphaerae TaxID=2100822 RepID=A0A2R8CII2_9GAMM|nr:hypothetical protein [Kushneria phyllosphaerae]SPJ32690.1 hypothetical protein KSP9073_00691 [Kushneria phyllosphaerae]
MNAVEQKQLIQRHEELIEVQKLEEDVQRLLENPEFWDDIENREQLDAFICKRVIATPLILHSNLGYLDTLADHTEYKADSRVGFSKSHINILETLSQNLNYRNLIIVGRQDLAQQLGVNPKNLKRTLDSVSTWIHVLPNTKAGEVRILINPAYAYRFPYVDQEEIEFRSSMWYALFKGNADLDELAQRDVVLRYLIKQDRWPVLA